MFSSMVDWTSVCAWSNMAGVDLLLRDAVLYEALGGGLGLPGHNAVVIKDVFAIDGSSQLASSLHSSHRAPVSEAAAGKPEVQEVCSPPVSGKVLNRFMPS